MSPAMGTTSGTGSGRRPAWLVADVAVVLLLVGLAVVGLASTFVGWGFMIVAGIAAGLGIVVVLLTLRLPALSLLVSGPLVGILLAGPVALRSSGFGGGIPDGQTLADVMQGSVTGWGEMLTTLPRVDLSGAPTLVPFLLGYLGALLGCALAMRSRSPGAPVLPLLSVLAGVLLVRRPATGLVEWHPVAFAVLALVWVAFRGLGFVPEVQVEVRGRARGRFARGSEAVLVVAAALLVAVPLTSGGAVDRGETLRGRIGPLPVVAHLDSPLRNFRAYTEQPLGTIDNLNTRTLVEVAGAPEGSRVRFLTLDRYDGKEWAPDNGTMAGTTDDRFQRMDTTVENPTPGTPIRVRVTVKKSYRSAWVPTVGSLTALRFLYADPNSRRDELRYDVATSTAVLPLGVKAGNDYEFTAVLPDDRLTRTMRAWPTPVLSVAHANRADALIRRVLASPAAPMGKVFVLARYLRDTGLYSNGAGPAEERYEAGHDVKRLFKGFLLARRAVGDDEQYAAAMAVLANRVGVPARVVVGAVLPSSGRVRGSDVQAWVEVRIADGSWRTLPTEQFMSRRPPTTPQPPPALPPQVPSRLEQQPEKPATQQEKKKEKQATDEAGTQWRAVLVRALPVLVLLLLALVVPLVKWVRRRLRRTRGRPSDRMAGAWTELVDHALDLGIPVHAHASRPAQARVLATAGALSRRGDDGVFAAEEPGEEEVHAYWEQVLRERRRLRHGRPLLRRAWAAFNPVTLVGRPRPD
jgi:transglutaminase-like putative cysteine protease